MKLIKFIEQDLNNAISSKKKKKILFYKMALQALNEINAIKLNEAGIDATIKDMQKKVDLIKKRCPVNLFIIHNSEVKNSPKTILSKYKKATGVYEYEKKIEILKYILNNNEKQSNV